jgi:membrane-bound lytic murein transglycosylase B
MGSCKRHGIAVFLSCVVVSFIASPTTSLAKDRPTQPNKVVWVVDETQAKLIVSALSMPSSVSSGPDHQRAIHALVLNPELREPVVSAIKDAGRQSVVRQELSAAVQLRRLTKAQPQLPQWRILAPATAVELRAAYDAAEKDTGVGWQYLAAVNFVETKFGRIRGTSTAGAQGPMQFLPSTWKQYGKGGDINSDRDAIAAAARFLKAKGAPGNMRKALFRYNNSNLYVDAVMTYAQNMQADQTMLNDYHAWSVIFRWVEGDVILQEGYGA